MATPTKQAGVKGTPRQSIRTPGINRSPGGLLQVATRNVALRLLIGLIVGLVMVAITLLVVHSFGHHGSDTASSNTPNILQPADPGNAGAAAGNSGQGEGDPVDQNQPAAPVQLGPPVAGHQSADAASSASGREGVVQHLGQLLGNAYASRDVSWLVYVYNGDDIFANPDGTRNYSEEWHHLNLSGDTYTGNGIVAVNNVHVLSVASSGKQFTVEYDVHINGLPSYHTKQVIKWTIAHDQHFPPDYAWTIQDEITTPRA